MIITFVLILVIGCIVLVSYLWRKELCVPKIPLRQKSELHDNIKCIETWLDSIAKKNKFNGGVVIKYNDQILLKGTFGNRSFNNVPVNNDSMFRLASLSKSYTAFGIMWLVKKYGLSYESSISSYLKFPTDVDITIRNLLNHTSGIREDYISLAKRRVKPYTGYVLTIKEAVQMISENVEESTIESNTEYLYNNSNYVLLAGIIEEVSGISFEEYMRIEIFEPLELYSTRVWSLISKTSLEDEKNIAMGFESYLGCEPIAVKPTWIDGVAGDGGVFSSINDLEKWSAIWDSNHLLTKEEMKPAFDFPQLNNGDKSTYGFGWILNKHSFWHNGKWLAANSFMMKKKTNHFSLILVDNSANMRFEKILERVITQLKYLEIIN